MNIEGLGERLKISRNRTGLSQDDIGKIVGVKGATISLYETGGAVPSTAVLMKLASQYRVSIDWLLGITKEKNLAIDDLSESNIELLQRMADIMKQADESCNNTTQK